MRVVIHVAMAVLVWANVHLGDVAGADTAAGAPELVVQTGHQHQVRLAVFSSDSRLIASGDIRGSIRIWDTATGKLLQSLSGHRGDITSLSFSPDGRRLASAGDHGPSSLVKIWDVGTGSELHRLTGHQKRIKDVAFSPNGALLATTGEDVRLWDTASGRQTERIEALGYATTLAFSTDGRLLAIREPSRVRLWTIGRGELVTLPLGNFYGRRLLAFTRDGTKLAVPDGERLTIIDVSQRKSVADMTIGHNSQVLGFTEEHCVIRRGRAYELWDISAQKRVRTLHRGSRSDAQLSPDLRRVVALNEPGISSLTLAEIGVERQPIVLASRVAVAGAVAFSPGGSLLATKSGGILSIKRGATRMCPRRYRG
jgi:WD40 repeat protein